MLENHNNCPNCKGNIPLSWLLFSAYWTKYRCIYCKALVQWASRRSYVGGIAGVFGGFSTVLLGEYIPSIFWRFFIVLAVVFVLMLAVPKQYELAEDQE